MATPLAPYIGYALAAAIAKEAVATGRTIRELVLDKGIFDQEALDVILDPFELTEPGVAGGFRYEPTMPEISLRFSGVKMPAIVETVVVVKRHIVSPLVVSASPNPPTLSNTRRVS